MLEWAYKALGPDGKLLAGKEVAADRTRLADILRRRGAILLESREADDAARSRAVDGRVDPRALVDFASQLAMLYRSGVPIVAGLGDLVGDVEDPRLKSVLADVHRRIGAGEQLSSALGRFPKAFGNDFIQIVVSGEEAGELDRTLDRLAATIEWRQETARKFKGAFVYPAVLLTAVTGLIVLIVTFLVPRLSQIFLDAGVELPTVTRTTLAVADFLDTHAPAILAAIGALALSFAVIRRTGRGRSLLHAAFLKLPLVGPLALMMESSSFSSTLGLLLNSGVPLVRSLELTSQATRNVAMRAKVSEIHGAVLHGTSFSESLRAAGSFPPLVLRMVALGEQTGSMVESLDRVTAFFDKEIPRRIKRFLGLLEPTITLVMGAAVCFAVFSAFLPMMKLLGAMRG
ncbi:MAG: type II secretion system F family protein [Planctomycetota bacterium]